MKRITKDIAVCWSLQSAHSVGGSFVALLALAASSAYAIDIEGFTEPHRAINVAADETGIIAEVLVREGEKVKSRQPLVRLDAEVHLAALAIAEHNMQCDGPLDAALAEAHVHQERLKKLVSLHLEGYARQEEVDRAKADVAIAEANVRAEREELLARKLEYEKIRMQIGRRTIHAPVAGTVTKLHKQPGEYIAPNNPDVLTLVELNPLLAVFTVLSPKAATLRMGTNVQVRLSASGQNTKGVIEFIAPQTDPESGTVLIKVRIDNPDGRFRSGERCQIRLPD